MKKTVKGILCRGESEAQSSGQRARAGHRRGIFAGVRGIQQRASAGHNVFLRSGKIT